MEWFVRAFIRAALVWLGVGVLLGLGMAFAPELYPVRPAHMHANLLGFVSMMIFGVAYHVLPRFAGRMLHRRSWAALHFWLANVGLTLQVSGFLMRAAGWRISSAALGTGALLGAVGIGLFIVNIWVTVGERLPLSAQVRPMDRPRTAPAGDTP